MGTSDWLSCLRRPSWRAAINPDSWYWERTPPSLEGSGRSRDGAGRGHGEARAHSRPRQAVPAARLLLVSLAFLQPLLVPVVSRGMREGPAGSAGLHQKEKCFPGRGTAQQSKMAPLHRGPGPPAVLQTRPSWGSAPAHPSLTPGGLPSPAAPLLSHICRTFPWTLQPAQ